MNNVFKVSVNGLPAEVNFFKFSGGETQVTFKNPSTEKSDCNVSVHALIREGDIMPLSLLVDAIRRTIDNPIIKLVMPYLPYARQDRVMNPGEALAVKVFADAINALKFHKVTISDCHSDVGLALIDRVTNDSSLELYLMDKTFDALVAPDAGALKKTFKYAKILGINDVLRADKTRDVSTGEITGTVVHGDVEGKRCLIIDDLVDGGKSFIELGKKLKELGASKVTLYVTHGIFSKGKDVFEGTVDEVYAKYDWTQL